MESSPKKTENKASYSSNITESPSNKTKNKAASVVSEAEVKDPKIVTLLSPAQKQKMKDEAKQCADKYNYDFENDVPLKGKYEWVVIKK